ncbi:MAG: RsmD family RNA methyltransferase [Candidatus Eisenbacteria bacterium]
MRIVAGARRGARLYTGKAPGFRPTSDRVREAIFDILGGLTEGRRVLDLFAGSGALGFEALSRGALEALFVEKSRRIAGWIERNGRDLRFDDRITVHASDAVRFLKRGEELEKYDLLFADPPYGAGLVRPALEGIAAIPGPRRVVLERDRREDPGIPRTGWRRAAAYGDTVVEFLSFGESPEEESR